MEFCVFSLNLVLHVPFPDPFQCFKLSFSQDAERPRVPVMRLKVTLKVDSLKRALVNQSSQGNKSVAVASQKTTDVIQKPSGTSQRTSMHLGKSSRSPKDMMSFEWALKYKEESRRLILSLGKTTRPEC